MFKNQKLLSYLEGIYFLLVYLKYNNKQLPYNTENWN